MLPTTFSTAFTILCERFSKDSVQQGSNSISICRSKGIKKPWITINKTSEVACGIHAYFYDSDGSLKNTSTVRSVPFTIFNDEKLISSFDIFLNHGDGMRIKRDWDEIAVPA